MMVLLTQSWPRSGCDRASPPAWPRTARRDRQLPACGRSGESSRKRRAGQPPRKAILAALTDRSRLKADLATLSEAEEIIDRNLSASRAWR